MHIVDYNPSKCFNCGKALKPSEFGNLNELLTSEEMVNRMITLIGQEKATALSILAMIAQSGRPLPPPALCAQCKKNLLNDEIKLTEAPL